MTDTDDECDYLVIGGGATGMAFSDTLLKHSGDDTNHPPKVVVVDKHAAPGGQWHDSYDFVRLHQPSHGYGVESRELEPAGDGDNETLPAEERHRATREEILRYYADVGDDLRSKHGFVFLGGHTLDLAQLETENDENKNENENKNYVVTNNATGKTRTIRVRKKVVDARNLEPDLPVSTPPKFGVPPSGSVSVLPVNDLAGRDAATAHDGKRFFVVIGGGKTGMDAVSHLLETRRTLPENLLWVVPNDAWITAREKIGNCIDLLYTAAKLHDERRAGGNGDGDYGDDDEKKETDAAEASSAAASGDGGRIGPDFFQRAFLEWEKRGHVYRLDKSVVPTKFKDATLSASELTILGAALPRIVRRGRLSEITQDGAMVFKDGSVLGLPFPVDETLFVHCSAGAFHCSRSHASPPPVFENHRITVQDVYGTPGFCFVGSVLGKLESLAGLSDDERNAMALRPLPPSVVPPGERSGGDVFLGGTGGSLSGDHPFVQRARNLRAWLDHPGMRDWVVSNRLFHLVGTDPGIVSDKLDGIFRVLRASGVDVDVVAAANH